MNRIRKHLASYRYALNGIFWAFRNENNMVFHLAAGVAVLVTNILLGVTRFEWIITLMVTGIALMAELFNTAIEKLADRITKDQDPLIGRAKDIASGAVLIICGFAIICAALIYLPYLVKATGSAKL